MRQTTLIPTAASPTYTPKEIALVFCHKEETVRDKSRKPKVIVTDECLRCSTPMFITITKSTGYQNVAQNVYSNHKG
jgi:hypothetical protein